MVHQLHADPATLSPIHVRSGNGELVPVVYRYLDRQGARKNPPDQDSRTVEPDLP